MQRMLLRSKIHRATITGAHVEYEGSIALDAALMKAADFLPGERVQVLNLSNGSRLETYVIQGESGSGQVELNGPAALLGQVGEKVIIAAYGLFDPAEVAAHEPVIVHVDDANRPLPERS